MRLALSSAAAPALELAELVDACDRRGLLALFLAGEMADELLTRPARAVEVAYRTCESVPVAGLEGDWASARLASAAIASGALDAPVVTPAEQVDVEALASVAAAYQARGGTLLLAVSSDPEAARRWAGILDGIGSPALGLAWEVRPGEAAPDRMRDLLAAIRPKLGLVRLHGGGPETIAQEGLGVGPIMARLTLAGYTGPLVIGPSRPETRTAWAAWLRRRAGTGCGSAAGLTPLHREVSR